jgi:hypothetical protein
MTTLLHPVLLGLFTFAPAASDLTLPGEPPPSVSFALALEIQTEWQIDTAHRLFSRKRADTGGGVSLSYDVARPSDRTALALSLAYHQRDTTSGWAFRDGDAAGTPGSSVAAAPDATLDTNTLSLGAALRWSLAPWFEPHLRVAVDGTHADITLQTPDGGPLDGEAWSAGASAGAGFRLRTRASRLRTLPGDPALAVALVAEGGFHFGLPLPVEVAPRRPPDEKVASDLIPSGAIRLGELGRSFPYLRVSAALLF